MPREITQHSKSLSKRSRSRGRHRSGDTRGVSHRSNGDKSSVSEVNDQLPDEAAEHLALKVAAWSEPILDTHSSRFQYQTRLLPDGRYQWTISGSDSGTNPHYLPPTSASNMGYHLESAAYPTSTYIVQQPLQTEAQYYDPGDTSAEPDAALDGEGEVECTCKDCRKENTSGEDRSERRRKKTSNNHQTGKRDQLRDHSSHRRYQYHYRSKSREDKSRRRHAYRGRDYDEKVGDWLYDYDYE